MKNYHNDSVLQDLKCSMLRKLSNNNHIQVGIEFFKLNLNNKWSEFTLRQRLRESANR